MDTLYTVKVTYLSDGHSATAEFDNRDDAWQFMRDIDATDWAVAGYPAPHVGGQVAY